jgi:hypothetical protein
MAQAEGNREESRLRILTDRAEYVDGSPRKFSNRRKF